MSHHAPLSNGEGELSLFLRSNYLSICNSERQWVLMVEPSILNVLIEYEQW